MGPLWCGFPHREYLDTTLSGLDLVTYVGGMYQGLVFIPAPLLVLATGITMVAVNDAWAFSQPWVYLTLALFVADAILAGAVGGKTIGRIQEGWSQGADVSAFVDRYLSIAWVDVAILTVILALMVFKPGL